MKEKTKGRGSIFLNREYDGDLVPKTTKWVFSIAGMFRDACYSLVSAFMLTYMMYSGVLNDPSQYANQMLAVTIIMVIALIWDGLNDPIMGFLVEKIHFKMGKYRPWILIGGIGNTIVVLCLFLIRPTGWGYVATWAVFYFLWDFVFTMNDIAYWSMLPSLSSDQKQRNDITTVMSIFISIGTFGCYAVCSLLPNAGNYSYIFSYIAVPIALLFLLSQLAIFFLCKEHKRDPKQDVISSKTKFTDMFTILGKNKPLLYSVIAMFLYYTAGSLIIGFGLNYFYFTFGFGGGRGGTIQTIFTVMFALGTVIAQVAFTWLSKKFKKQTLLTWSFIIAFIAYVFFFIVGTPLFGENPIAYNNAPLPADADFGAQVIWAFGGNFWMLYVAPFIFFGAQSIFNLVILMMMQNSIEFNEWKNGERKESVVFSWRPFDAKISSALQKGLVYGTLAVAGIYSAAQQISVYESKLAENIALDPTNADKYKGETTSLIELVVNSVTRDQKIILGACMVGGILIFLTAAYLILHFKYDISEEKYDKIKADLDERHKKDFEEAKAAAAAN